MDDSAELPRPVFEVLFKPLDSLTEYARNAVKHSDESITLLAAAIEEYGFTKPVLADEKGLVAGHRRCRALRRLFDAGKTVRMIGGAVVPTNCAPVIDCSGWTRAQRQAYILWDNQSAAAPEWDFALLKIEIGELKGAGFDLPLLGFDDKTLNTLLDAPKAEEAETDDAEPNAEPDECRVIKCPGYGHDFSVLEQMTTNAKRRKKGAGGEA